MTANYEAEQHTLESRVDELKAAMTAENESSLNVDHFLALVRKYTDRQELTAEMIRELWKESMCTRRVDGRRVQRIKNCLELHRRVHAANCRRARKIGIAGTIHTQLCRYFPGLQIPKTRSRKAVSFYAVCEEMQADYSAMILAFFMPLFSRLISGLAKSLPPKAIGRKMGIYTSSVSRQLR